MEWANLVVAFALLAVTAGATVAALVQAQIAVGARRDAQAAQAEAEHARDEATTLTREANVAFTRQAEALDRANELAAQALPKPEVRWVIRPLRGSRWEAVNEGDVDIPSALLVGAGEAPGFVNPEEREARSVPRGDGLAFIAIRAMGPDPVLRIEYRNPLTGRDEFLERAIR